MFQNMNKIFHPWAAALLLASALTVSADPVRYQASPGSKLKLEGTSTVHDWSVSSGIMGGYIEFESDYPLDPTKPNPDAKITPKVEVKISVRSLQSGKSLMDDIMWDNLKVKDNPYITYKLTEWKPHDRKAGDPLQFDTKGDLTVAGVTKPIDMVVTHTPEGNKHKATGNKELKMSDFGMKAPAPSIGLGLIKTADEVKVTFEWVTTRKDTKKTAAAN
jgi:polyisoprenoid-binding protein YceI